MQINKLVFQIDLKVCALPLFVFSSDVARPSSRNSFTKQSLICGEFSCHKLYIGSSKNILHISSVGWTVDVSHFTLNGRKNSIESCFNFSVASKFPPS